jgi:hypothetical protein
MQKKSAASQPIRFLLLNLLTIERITGNAGEQLVTATVRYGNSATKKAAATRLLFFRYLSIIIIFSWH